MQTTKHQYITVCSKLPNTSFRANKTWENCNTGLSIFSECVIIILALRNSSIITCQQKNKQIWRCLSQNCLDGIYLLFSLKYANVLYWPTVVRTSLKIYTTVSEILKRWTTEASVLHRKDGPWSTNMPESKKNTESAPVAGSDTLILTNWNPKAVCCIKGCSLCHNQKKILLPLHVGGAASYSAWVTFTSWKFCCQLVWSQSSQSWSGLFKEEESHFPALFASK